jgi:uncharacterized protein with HEPN domain
MTRDDKVYLTHILESIVFIEKYCAKLTLREFFANEILQNAIVRQLEIIGEASNCISKTTQNKLKTVEWYKIIGMRNKLIHEYFGVDLNVVWTTIEEELPKLKTAIEEYLKYVQ